MNEAIDAIPTLVRELYAIVRQLEAHFPGRKFTPDGHLVGSLGEVLAAYRCRLDLLPSVTPSVHAGMVLRRSHASNHP